MGRRAKLGKCCICGSIGELTFEHIPPRRAFNHVPIRYLVGDDVFRGDPESKKSRISQRGFGSHTLCERCNNNTGSWYGTPYTTFAMQGMRVLLDAEGAQTAYAGYDIRPLRVLKQVIVMFMSANGAGFAPKNQELVRFVLDRRRRGLPPEYRIHAFLTRNFESRVTGVIGLIRSRTVRVLSEFVFPPFGFVLSMESEPPPEMTADLTDWANLEWADERQLWLDLPMLDTYTGFGADYRSREEARRQAGLSSD